MKGKSQGHCPAFASQGAMGQDDGGNPDCWIKSLLFQIGVERESAGEMLGKGESVLSWALCSREQEWD